MLLSLQIYGHECYTDGGDSVGGGDVPGPCEHWQNAHKPTSPLSTLFRFHSGLFQVQKDLHVGCRMSVRGLQNGCHLYTQAWWAWVGQNSSLVPGIQYCPWKGAARVLCAKHWGFQTISVIKEWVGWGVQIRDCEVMTRLTYFFQMETRQFLGEMAGIY